MADKSNEMHAVQFSKEGSQFYTMIKFEDRALAESVMKAAAGHGPIFGHPYWRVRQADQASQDFHAVISAD